MCKLLVTHGSGHCLHPRLLVLMAAGGGGRQESKAQQAYGAWANAAVEAWACLSGRLGAGALLGVRHLQTQQLSH